MSYTRYLSFFFLCQAKSTPMFPSLLLASVIVYFS